jgi:hypothetical protein
MTLEFYIAFDRAGDYKVGYSEQGAAEKYAESYKVETAINVVKVSLQIECPPPLTLSAVVPYSATSEVVELRVQKP